MPSIPTERHRTSGAKRRRRLTNRLVQAGVVRGATVAETLRVNDLPGFAGWVRGGVLAEQCSQRLVRPGAELELPTWTEHGSQSAERPAIVLLNGWTLSGNVWPSAFVERLAVDHRVIRIDNRGTGQRRGAALPFTIEDLANDVAAVIEAAELDRPMIVGFSLGGMIAMETALRQPTLVGALAVLSSRPPNTAQVQGTRSVATAFQSPDPARPFDEQLIERWGAVAGPGFADRHPERLIEMAEAALAARTPWRTVLAQARAVMGWHRPKRLRNIDVPTLIMHGDADPLSPLENGRRLAQLIPDAQLVELAGVGHLLVQEAPDRAAEHIIDHVARLTTGAGR